jgi:hypothetical protein
MSAPELTPDEHRVVCWLLETSIASLVLNGTERAVRERIQTALGMLRGDHHPRPSRRSRRRRRADRGPIETPESEAAGDDSPVR